MEEGVLDSGEGVRIRFRFVWVCGKGDWEGDWVGEVGGRRDETRTYLDMCPSRSRMVFICERRSGSWVVGVYVDAAFGTRTGVVGSSFMVSESCSQLGWKDGSRAVGCSLLLRL